MADMREVVGQLEGELQVKQEECGRLERIITELRKVYGIPEDDDVVDEEPAAVPTRGKNKRAESAKRPTDRPSKAQANKSGRRRVFDDGTDHTGAIVAAVRKAGGAIKRDDLRKALGTSLYHTIKRLKVALKAKAVVASGTKATYRITLPGNAPARGRL